MSSRIYIDFEGAFVDYTLFVPTRTLIAVSESDANFFMDGEGNEKPYVVNGRLF